MQIDRARFLLLTASLAGGRLTVGCGANGATNPQPVPTTEPTTGTELVVPETTDPGEPGTTSATTVASADPTTTSSRSDVPTGPCDNDTGTVPACSIAGPPGPHCEGLTETKNNCKGYKSALRPAIAAKAVACLNAASGTQAICDYTKSESCSSEAIRSACVQPSTFNACSPVVSQCAGFSWSKLTMNDCQAMLSAVKDGKRQAMITCMTEGCSLESCSWSLR